MTIFYILLAAIALGILIFIHELGHYFMARFVGMKVEIFSIGFGRPLLKWRVRGVDWQLGWLPFGGYVKIMGMELGKKEKEKGIEPYDIPDGFFAKAPWKRILVAIAGPLANLILAFLLFATLWMIGGREKPFSEYTSIVGWVDPKSEIHALGVRPGDEITSYNGKAFSGSKDHLYAAMLGGKDIDVEGYHVNYLTKEKRPFNYEIESYPAPNVIDGIKTTGILTGARYLIYDPFPSGQANPLPEGSPMEGSGVTYGDRLMWADGEILFSMEQLKTLLNSNTALLTVEREGKYFLSRQPKVNVSDFILSNEMKAELSDWQYEAGIKEKWNTLLTLPYNISSEGTIEHRLRFIDDDAYRQAFPLHPTSQSLETPLKSGDTILAVDGIPLKSGYQLLKQLQEKRVQIIVKQDVPLETKVLWDKEDAAFENSVDARAIYQLSQKIGTSGEMHKIGDYLLLPPITPKRLDQFALNPEAEKQFSDRMAEKRKAIEEIKDPKKKQQLLNALAKSENELLLGIYLQDRLVDYNPSPFALFGNVFTETWLTLKALVMGYLHPKWISGPVGIVQVIHHGWKVGIGEALFWISAISLNLGMLNLLPIPVLDGGYICMAFWELVTRRRLKAKTMERIIIPFVVILIALLVFLTFQDISRFF